MARFRADVSWHVHGHPGHSGRRHLAAEHPERARNISRRHELDSDLVSDRRNHRHSADRLVDARAVDALAVRRGHRGLYAGVDRLRLQRRLRKARRLSHHSGICRRHADPGGVRGGLPAVSRKAAGHRHHDRGHHGGAGSHRRARGRGLDHADLFLALAIPHQCRARSDCLRGHTLPAAETFTRSSKKPPGSMSHRWC